ncbi:MAG: LPP20 family lipoprotein [Gammaproteobacteria bacterium]|nr:LPP20 family lipoprotein [Gammaproteobacteria bacterium]
MKRILVLGLALLLVACGGSRGGVIDGGPDWLDGSSKRHPSVAYIIGVGSSASLDDAKNRARAEIAKVFEVAVTEQSSDNLKYLSDANGTQLAQRIERDTTSRTSQILHGVEIADSWLHVQSGRFYALAVLHRGRTATALRQQIEQLDQGTATHIEKARASKDSLDTLAHASSALSQQLQRAGLQRSLQVVDNSGRGITPRWNLAELSSDLRTQLERVRIQPNLSQGPNAFQASLSGALGEAGFLVKKGETPDFILTTRLVLGEPEYLQSWYWVRGRLEILLSTPQGRIRGSQRWPIKVSATQADVAQKRAMDSAATILKSELRSSLLGFARE